MLMQQYFQVRKEVHKMLLVQQEYYDYLDRIKQTIQDKNCDLAPTDLDLVEEKIEEVFEDKEEIADLLTKAHVDQALLEKEEILDEQEEDAEPFQFISPEDEKQLKDLRRQTRQVVAEHKKTKKKLQKNKKSSHVQKNISNHVGQDFMFHWPLELHHFWISSLFGARKKANGSPGFHYGIDLAAMKGTPVKAAAPGVVIQAQYVPGYGNNILIQHNKYYRTRYAHLQRMHVVVGQKVAVGQKIGAVGDTGSVRKSGRDASHLHFEIYHNGSHVNPLRYLFK
jgi:murein DD-endopeptidase MepM/ murein hydrolase activator NlpD